MYSTEQIKTCVYKVVKNSDLEKAVTGVLTKRKRPLNSNKEDIVITCPTTQNASYQKFIVYVNIYVQDLYVKENGQYEENTSRLTDLISKAFALFDDYHGDNFLIQNDSQDIEEIPSEEVHEHFAKIKLLLTIINF
jgi:hypothetical protein